MLSPCRSRCRLRQYRLRRKRPERQRGSPPDPFVALWRSQRSRPVHRSCRAACFLPCDPCRPSTSDAGDIHKPFAQHPSSPVGLMPPRMPCHLKSGCTVLVSCQNPVAQPIAAPLVSSGRSIRSNAVGNARRAAADRRPRMTFRRISWSPQRTRGLCRSVTCQVPALVETSRVRVTPHVQVRGKTSVGCPAFVFPACCDVHLCRVCLTWGLTGVGQRLGVSFQSCARTCTIQFD